ncbi:4545_t:CDS:2, partial [Ambispora gerdemannii]
RHSNTTPNRQELLREARAAWKQIKNKDETIIPPIANSNNVSTLLGQKNAIVKVKETTQQLYEYEQSYLYMPDNDLRQVLITKIEEKKKF